MPVPARSPTRYAVVTLLAVTALLTSCTSDPGASRGSAPSPGTSSAAERTGILVLPVVPVGGDLPTGRQTRRGAIADVDHIAATGASGIRMTADVRWLCETKTCTAAPLDPVVAHARKLGLRVYLQVNSTPSWLDDRGRWYGPVGDDAVVWAGLFAQLVARYGSKVSGYEVWNEPNLHDFWQQGPDPSEYADLLRAVWTAVQPVDPDAVLIGAVLSNNDLGYMHELDHALTERGGTPENGFFYDLLGVHPYAGGSGFGLDPAAAAGSVTDETSFGVKDMTFLGIDRLRRQVSEDEGIDRDLFVGEFGYDTVEGSWYHVAEPERAAFLGRALDLAGSRPWITAFVPYRYVDDPGDGFAIRGTASEAVLDGTGAN
jgi:hypothetical protein